MKCGKGERRRDEDETLKRNKLTSQPTNLPVFGSYHQNLFCIFLHSCLHFQLILESLSLSQVLSSPLLLGPKFSSICNGQNRQQEHTSQAGGYVYPFLCFACRYLLIASLDMIYDLFVQYSLYDYVVDRNRLWEFFIPLISWRKVSKWFVIWPWMWSLDIYYRTILFSGFLFLFLNSVLFSLHFDVYSTQAQDWSKGVFYCLWTDSQPDDALKINV